MTFKVGDKVRIVARDCGHGFKIGQVVTLEEKTGETEWFAGEYYMQEKEFEPIGKTLTELDVKPGDVVRDEDGLKYEVVMHNGCPRLRDIEDGDWSVHVKNSMQHYTIISRAEPAKPKRMHPDDVADAISEYALDCGYAIVVTLVNGNGTHIYES